MISSNQLRSERTQSAEEGRRKNKKIAMM